MTTIATTTGQYQVRSIRYTVESASVPGRVYTVTVDDGGWFCDCKAGEYTKTRGRCWHIKTARAGEAGKPRVALLPLGKGVVD
jgi:hypothetical protein